MQLVLLAAGHGRRFGGLKQLAPVGPRGEAIMDYTARSAEANGFRSVVLVVREGIRQEMEDHVRRHWPGSLQVDLVCQAPLPGTAQAVLSAKPLVGGAFAVANADDLYGEEALAALVPEGGFGAGSGGEGPETGSHLVVAYRLQRTILTSAPVTRGLCEVDDAHRLQRIAEHRVHRLEDGTFQAHPLGAPEAGRPLTGREQVSMNLWGFAHRMLDHLEEAISSFDPSRSARPELLLPDVVNSLVSCGRDQVKVVETAARCIGVTHQEDLALVRAELALEPEGPTPLPARSSN